MATVTTNRPFPGAASVPSGQSWAGAPTGRTAPEDPEVYSLFRRVGFYCLLALVFLFYTRLHEILTLRYGINGRFLYIFTIPALLGMLISGGVGRALKGRPTWYWLGFVAWMAISTPFSIWRGDSVLTIYDFLRAQLPVMILLAGLPMTWRECRLVLCTIGVAGVVNVLSSKFLGQDYSGRAGTEGWTIGNPNDYAGQLLMVLPVVVYMILHPPRVMFLRNILRAAGIAVVLYGAYLTLASGSRGAMLGLLGATGFVVLRASMTARAVMLLLFMVGVGASLAVLPSDVVMRLVSFKTEFDPNSEAAQSASLRKELALESMKAALRNPIFGVGPGQFGNYEGQKKKEGEHVVKAWYAAHNSYTEVAADNGIPGILFYLAGAISPFLLLQRTWKRLRGKPELREQADACFCLLVAWIGFCIAIFFLNFGYFFYLPAYAGLAVALSRGIAAGSKESAPVRAVAGLGGMVPAMAVPTLVAPITPPSQQPRAGSPNRFRFNRPR